MLDTVGQERERLDALFSDESSMLVAIRERTREGTGRRRRVLRVTVFATSVCHINM